VQAVWEVHDTPPSATEVEPGGEGGVGWIVHFVPFHLSDKRTAASTGPDSPTAVHAFGEVHEIASRSVAVLDTATADPCPMVSVTPLTRSAAIRAIRLQETLMSIPFRGPAARSDDNFSFEEHSASLLTGPITADYVFGKSRSWGTSRPLTLQIRGTDRSLPRQRTLTTR
jgi:hypothetical protein